MQRSVFILVRLLLVLLVGVDILIALAIGYHWQRGGLDGVRSWITHMHLSFGRSFDVPVNQAMINQGLTDFVHLIGVLLLLTLAIAFADRMLRRHSGGSA
jgi:hypothetical protein